MVFKEFELRYLRAVGLVSLLCILLFGLRIALVGNGRYWFAPGNLLLAWLALGFSWGLMRGLKKSPWLSGRNLLFTLLWLLFLPNAWYVLTDFIHVYPNGEINQLFDITLVGCLAVAGLTLGFTSLYLVHMELRSRLSQRETLGIILTVILGSSFAIYLGRILRWNTWDIITNPGGLLLNITDRIIDPLAYPRAINLTALFFVVISTFLLGSVAAGRAPDCIKAQAYNQTQAFAPALS